MKMPGSTTKGSKLRFETPQLTIYGSIREMTRLKCPKVTNRNEAVNVNDNTSPPDVCKQEGRGRKKT